MTDEEIMELVNTSMAAQKNEAAKTETLKAVSSAERLDSELSVTESLLAQVREMGDPCGH